MSSTTKMVTFGKNDIIMINSISYLYNKASFYNILGNITSVMKKTKKLYEYNRSKRINTLVRFCSALSTHKDVKHVNIKIKRSYDYDIFMKDFMTMIECGFSELQDKTCEKHEGDVNMLLFEDKYGNIISIDQDLEINVNDIIQ